MRYSWLRWPPSTKSTEKRPVRGALPGAIDGASRAADVGRACRLAGSARTRQQIEAAVPAEEIAQSWAAGVEDFERLRTPFLLY